VIADLKFRILNISYYEFIESRILNFKLNINQTPNFIF